MEDAMTLLTIAKGLARNVGMQVPTSVIGSSAREWQEALQFANETGEELARRADWGVLQQSTTLTGDGTNLAHPLPAGFSRLNRGIAVRAGSGIVRPLTRAEWNVLTPVEGTPRYFLLEGDTLTLFPYLANAATVTVQYQTENWTSDGGAEFLDDSETPLFDEALFLKGLIARWRRQKGMPYQDEEAEYEAALQDFSNFDDRSRF
jgi:hypothetical protein